MLTFQPEDMTTKALHALQKAIANELAARNIPGEAPLIADPEALAKLRPTVEPGGLLYGAEVRSTDLCMSSRAWRDLKTDPDGYRSKLAHLILHELGVTYRDTGKDNARMFYLSAF